MKLLQLPRAGDEWRSDGSVWICPEEVVAITEAALFPDSVCEVQMKSGGPFIIRLSAADLAKKIEQWCRS